MLPSYWWIFKAAVVWSFGASILGWLFAGIASTIIYLGTLVNNDSRRSR